MGGLRLSSTLIMALFRLQISGNFHTNSSHKQQPGMHSNIIFPSTLTHGPIGFRTSNAIFLELLVQTFCAPTHNLPTPIRSNYFDVFMYRFIRREGGQQLAVQCACVPQKGLGFPDDQSYSRTCRLQKYLHALHWTSLHSFASFIAKTLASFCLFSTSRLTMHRLH